MTTNSPRPFEVWRLEFVYEDQPEVSKVRPAIVAVVNHDKDTALVAKVTGHGPRPEFPGEVRIVDWKQAGLTKPSTVRCSKTMTVPLAAFDNASRYGPLSEEDARAVEQALRDLGAIL